MASFITHPRLASEMGELIDEAGAARVVARQVLAPGRTGVTSQCPVCQQDVDMYKPNFVATLFTRVGDFYRFSEHYALDGIKCSASNATPNFGGTKCSAY